ncbi:hypothetical protein LIER_37024 [Lithospermum erythrorhizon]|uniref:Uncharacterized protein n=1 Tax=Lithospermum erythrorhizon TaxID=34254 RepID=A0AAV3PE17_LITER
MVRRSKVKITSPKEVMEKNGFGSKGSLIRMVSFMYLKRCTNLGSNAFSLHFKPFFFWCKHGSKKLNLDDTAKKSACVFWDFSKAKFGTGLEPQSDYFVAVVTDREMAFLVGDLVKEAYGRTKARMQSERRL